MMDDYSQKLSAIKECISYYSSPIFIVGSIDDFMSPHETVISATMPREELTIINGRFPNWYRKVYEKDKDNNILVITDFDRISEEEQKLFIDILCESRVSSEELPDNLKIVINAKKPCVIIPKIREVIQYFEL